MQKIQAKIKLGRSNTFFVIVVLNNSIRGVVSNEETFWSWLVKILPNSIGIDTDSVDATTLSSKLDELNPSLIIQNSNLGRVTTNYRTISFLQDPLLAIMKDCYPLHVRVRSKLRGRRSLSDQIRQQIDSLEKSIKVTNSNYMANLYRDLGPFEVVPMGVNHELFRPLDKQFLKKKHNIPADRKVNIFVGSRHPVKGFNKIERMIQEGSDYWILVLKDFDLKSGHNFTCFYRVSQEVLAELYNCADLCVARSVTESFGLAVVEAMFCDVPVDATKTGVFWDWQPDFDHPRKEAFQKGLDKNTWMRNWIDLTSKILRLQ